MRVCVARTIARSVSIFGTKVLELIYFVLKRRFFFFFFFLFFCSCFLQAVVTDIFDDGVMVAFENE